MVKHYGIELSSFFGDQIINFFLFSRIKIITKKEDKNRHIKDNFFIDDKLLVNPSVP